MNGRDPRRGQRAGESGAARHGGRVVSWCMANRDSELMRF